MHAFILLALSVILAAGGAGLVIAAERRAVGGPRPGDAAVTALSAIVDRPGDGQTVVTAAIANPGSVPVLVGLSLRRKLLPGGRIRTMAARRTARKRYHASRQTVVAAVPDGATTRLSVPVPDRRRHFRLVAVIGQPDGRLCVISAPVTIQWPGTAVAPPHSSAREALFPWQRWLAFYEHGDFWSI